MADKKIMLNLKRSDGNITKAQLVAASKAEAKSILLHRWQGRYENEAGDQPGSDAFVKARDAWIKDTYGEFI